MSTKFFFIAGEPSGDALGASLIKSLKATGGDFEFAGVGGDFMAAQGMPSLLPMDELCVMGLWEVLSQITRLNRLIGAMVEEIEGRQPDVLVTIDLPDFNFRVAERLKKRGKFKGRIVHYGAPTVWAWRPGRAKKVAQFLDGMMCLFPFEPEYFTKHGLKSAFVGHPLAEVDLNAADKDAFLTKFNIPADSLKIGVFFGSRASEINNLGQTFTESFEILEEQQENITFIVPTLPSLEMEITNLANDLPGAAYISTDQEKKWEAFAACDVAVAVSGTVGLELAYVGVPHLISYKVHPITWVLLKLLVKVKYAHLGNILLDKPVVPELLQFKCSPFNIARGTLELIKKPEVGAAQKEGFAELKKKLSPEEGVLPSQAAAQFVLKFVGKPKAKAGSPQPQAQAQQ